MPDPDIDLLTRIVQAHLGDEVTAKVNGLLSDFADRLRHRQNLATDQLLNAVFLVTRDIAPHGNQRDRLVELLLHDLSSS